MLNQKRINLENKNIGVYLYLLIPLAIYIIFFIVPNVKTLLYSFFTESSNNPNNPFEIFIGIKNYLRLFGDKIFVKSLINTLLFTITLITFQNVIGLILAILLYKKSKTNIFFRVLMFMPAMMSTAATGIIWVYMYDANVGAINYVIKMVGLGNLQTMWLADSRIAIFSVAVTAIWVGIGYSMILFIAGMQNISSEIYEAAQIDGVGRWQNFIHITMPMLKSTTSVILIITTINGFRSFDYVYVMTMGGTNHSSEVLATYLYKQAFEFFNVSYASAIAVFLIILVLIISIFQLLATREY